MLRLFGAGVLLIFMCAFAVRLEAAPLSINALQKAFGPEDTSRILASAKKILNARPQSAPASAARVCLASSAAAPILGSRAISVVRSMATRLVQLGATGGRYAWTFDPQDDEGRACGEPGSFDAFKDGTCNSPRTKYMYQTSLALRCLADAYALTGDVSFRKSAERAISETWQVGTTPSGCPNCFYYWYSDSPNDADRYVRNTNVGMAQGLLDLYKITKDQKLLDRVNEIANAEHAEREANNYGYLGLDDPKWQANPAKQRLRIDNHLSAVAVGLFEIGVALNRPSIKDDAVWNYLGWKSCAASACLGSAACKQWAAGAGCSGTHAAAPCYFRGVNSTIAAACSDFIETNSRYNAYQLWMILSGLNTG